MAYERNDRDARDRSFFDRAGDEVRSWFGDEEAERRRRIDERYDERAEYGRGGYGDRGAYADRSHGGYEDARDDRGYRAGYDRGGYGRGDYGRGYAGAARSNRDDGRGYARSYPSEPYYDNDAGRQFDDIGPRQSGYGYRSQHDADDRGRAERARVMRDAYARGGYSWTGDRSDRGGRDDDHGHGESYRQWRTDQIAGFDRDYDEYRRENRSRFQSEFATWRQTRQTQRDSLSQVKEHHEVVGSDGAHVGTVDHVRSDHILLTKSDPAAGGHHHAIPSSWIASVSDKVVLSKTAADAKRDWQDKEQRSGLFGGRDAEGDDAGARTDLGRSFSGTY